MKPIKFLGNSLKALRDFPADAMQDAGYQLNKVQQEDQPDDFKPMPSIGVGVEEIRIWDTAGTFRVIYLVWCLKNTQHKRCRELVRLLRQKCSQGLGLAVLFSLSRTNFATFIMLRIFETPH